MSAHLAPLPALTDLGDLARMAGREILRHFEIGCERGAKADGSPVTDADREAEAIILQGLERLSPGIPVVAEEEVAANRAPDCGDVFFLVDPLDGTRDFIETRRGEFTVNIALVEHGRPRLGVVYRPTTGDLFLGGPEGAWRAACETLSDAPATLAPIRVSARPAPFRLYGSRRSKSAKRFLDATPVSELISISSSIKFCLLAAGEGELYPRFESLSEWDVAAGHAVLEAAGGSVIGLDGGPLRYAGQRDSYRLKGFVACGGAPAEAAARVALAAIG